MNLKDVVPYLKRREKYFSEIYGGPTVAWSLIQLSPTATNCIRVKRSSDNTEQDFGFVNRYVDISSISTFVGSGNGDIVTCYDQFGTNHLTVSTGVIRIITAGTVQLSNYLPAMYFNGSSSFQLTNTISPTRPWTCLSVVQRTSTSAMVPLLSSSTSGGPFANMHYIDSFDYLRHTNGTSISSATNTTVSQEVLANLVTTSATTIYRNENTVAKSDFGTGTAATFNRFGQRETVYSTGFAQVCIFYNSDKSTQVVSMQNWLAQKFNTYVTSSARSGAVVGVWGQSNGTDRFNITGNLPTRLQGVQSDSWTLYKPVNNLTDNGTFQKMQAGVNTMFGTVDSNKFPVGLSFADRIKYYGKSAYMVPCAVGGTGLDNSAVPGWNSTHTGEYYSAGITHMQHAIAKLSRVSSVVPMIVWIQGEYDAASATYSANYQSNIVAIINKSRTDLGVSNMLWVLVKLRPDSTHPHWATINAAMDYAAANLSNVKTVDPNQTDIPLSSDFEHYEPTTDNFAGHKAAINLGIKIADATATHYGW